jgi:hypothetical protein
LYYQLIRKARLQLKDGTTGAVTLIQRFGSALNLNIHFHILFLDGVYVYRDNRPPRFQRVKAPAKSELEELLPRACYHAPVTTRLVQLISQRVGRSLERQGLLEQDADDCMDAGGRAKQEPEPRTPGWNSTPPKTPTPCPRSWVAPSPTGSLSVRSKGARLS